MALADSADLRRRKTDTCPYLPDLNSSFVITLLLAGLVATGVWEIWARAITPLLIGGPLQPAGLIKASFGISSSVLAETIHILTGLIAYPLGYLLVAQPVARALPINLPSAIVGFGYGVGLFVFAMYVMAHLVAGFPPFLGFGNLAWASLGGHVLYGLAVAGIVAARRT
ncbi:MAG: hypothetical protein ABJL55_06810 [Roseibium sp.]